MKEKVKRLKEYIENERKYWSKYITTDGSTEASYYLDTWLSDFTKILKEYEGGSNEEQ